MDCQDTGNQIDCYDQQVISEDQQCDHIVCREVEGKKSQDLLIAINKLTASFVQKV